MVKRLILAALLCLTSSVALAQGCGPTNPNCTVPTRPFGDSTNAAASTAFVQQAIAAIGQAGQIVPNLTCDGATDNTATLNAAIATANSGGNAAIVFKPGRCVATSALSTITASNVWFYCPAGPGACVLVGGANNEVTWTGQHGGAFNMGFDNNGATNNNSIAANGYDQQFIFTFLGPNVGTFLTNNGQAATVLGAFGDVSCAPAVPIFVQQANGLYIRDSQINGSCAVGAATAGRYFIQIGNGSNSIDTTIVENNFVQVLDGVVTLNAGAGQSLVDFFFSGNVWDGMSNGKKLTVASTGNLSVVNSSDAWLGVSVNGSSTNGACWIATGAGTLGGLHVTDYMPYCAGSGFIGSVTGTAQFWDIGIRLEGGNNSNLGGTFGLNLNSAGAGNWNNIVVNKVVVSKGIISGNALGTGCAFGGVVDNLTFTNNNCQGTTPYNGMLAGTTSTFAHTNTKQRANIGLQDAPVLTTVEGGIGGLTFEAQGRLTLISHTPVMSTSTAAATTVYYDSYIGNLVPYYTGSVDSFDTIPANEVSTALSNAGASALNANRVFDVWWVHSGANRICVATNGAGAGWDGDVGGSNTARGTGYTQINRTTRAYPTNNNAIAHCYNGTTDYGSVPANQATYLGTLATTGSAGTTAWTINQSGAGGGPSRLYLWNMYNRVFVATTTTDTTASWNYTSTVPRNVNASANNSISFVSGLAEDAIFGEILGRIAPGAVLAAYSQVGFGLDTTTYDKTTLTQNPTAASFINTVTAQNTYAPQVGLHSLNALENSDGANATTFFGGTTQGLTLHTRM